MFKVTDIKILWSYLTDARNLNFKITVLSTEAADTGTEHICQSQVNINDVLSTRLSSTLHLALSFSLTKTKTTKKRKKITN